MKKAIVTGATGFIGSWLTEDLLNAGYEVIAVVREPDRLLPQIRSNKHCRVICKDLREFSSADIPSDHYDTFYNLGWAGVSPEQKNDVELQISNIPMAIKALDTCRELGCGLFIGTGTVAEYALTKEVLDLSARQSPNDMYGAAKVSTHYFLQVHARKRNQPFIWAVLPSTFGERRTDNNIITYTIRTLLKGDKPCYGNLEQMWDFLYVSEVARALRLIGEKGIPGKVYGIGSGEYHPLKEYICKIRDAINPDLELGIGEVPTLSEQSFSSCVNIDELIRDTGFRPDVSFREGMEQTILYWKQKGEETREERRNCK